ncbi:dolichol-phosphate mannosyltransferase subunit 3 [Rhopalosiphum maidis]|uniref:dolichol-phosphate mannosyltransferase subunit 3 n=1 Tax=Rhopalosiphum maidis TaxID=43146 RepID=UPI000EFEE863|nr:dolichol-phosphate mannosyltransferase subunit 3 [Rhopalosiphum maidis]XP_060841815.1 dolichol-phosphate mannosyltransferase subunit 3 [Rhopalosiphum padi]
MKKLTQWVVGVNILSILWLSLLFNQYDSKISKEYFLVIQFLPIILLICFGVFSLAVILYRVATFNDCKLAAEDLQAEIKEARIALRQKGFKFD